MRSIQKDLVRLVVNITPEMAEEIEQEAVALGCNTVAEYVRMVLLLATGKSRAMAAKMAQVKRGRPQG